MVDALEAAPQHRRALGEPSPPDQRVGSALPARVPTVADLITEAHRIATRDSLPFSGHIVIQRKGAATHRHDVWILGPFALVAGGWFGRVHGSEHPDGKPPRWLSKHERKCPATHWTQFSWIDESALAPGCGDAGIGIGLGPDGPVYCASTAAQSTDGAHEHIPLASVLRAGLRALADLD